MKRIPLCLVALGAVVACRDQRSLTSPKLQPPSAAFSDGRVAGGNPHFFFLPPLVNQAAFSGVFNPNLQPVVVICELDVDVDGHPIGCSGAPTISPGPSQLDPTGQQYLVNWNTGQPAINPDKFYRIQVFGSRGGMLLGFADLDPVNNGSQLKNVNTGEFIGLVDGRTLPIKFRIELGAFLPSFACTDCAEQTVSNDGGVVVTNTGFAGASLPSLWLRPDFLKQLGSDNVVVTIERVRPEDVGGSCIPLNAPGLQRRPQQAEGCYRFTTSPDVGLFALDVTVGVCIEVPSTDARFDAAQLFKIEEPVGEIPVVFALRNTPAPFVHCEGFAAAHPAGSVANLARALLRHVGSWLSPTFAYAAHEGAGGLSGSFSRIGWVLPTATVNFDVTPGPEPVQITNGEDVTDLYNSEGVRFTASSEGREGCSDGPQVFANNGGGSLSTNAVSICSSEVAGFSDVVDGRVRVGLDQPASKVCIDVTPMGEGSSGFLMTFEGEATQTVTSVPGIAQLLCVESVQEPGIQFFQFAGTGSTRAIFDNLSVTFGPF